MSFYYADIIQLNRAVLALQGIGMEKSVRRVYARLKLNPHYAIPQPLKRTLVDALEAPADN